MHVGACVATCALIAVDTVRRLKLRVQIVGPSSEGRNQPDREHTRVLIPRRPTRATISPRYGGQTAVRDALEDEQTACATATRSRTLRRHSVIPPMVAQMIAVGEETGAVDDLLTRVGEFYELEVETAVDALASVIEPVMIAVMGLVIGSMVLALYLPMFNVIKLVQ